MEKTDEFLVCKLINELYKQREWLAFKDIGDDKSIKNRLQDLHAVIMSTKFVKEDQIGMPYIYKYLIQPFGILQLKKHSTFEKYLDFITQEKERKKNIDLLTLDNLNFQSKNNELSKELTDAQLKLTKLQIKEKRKKIIYSIIGFIAGAIVTNAKDIWHLMKRLFHI